MSNPQTVYVDQSNNVLVPDFDNACIYKFNSTGGTLVTPIVIAGQSDSPGNNLNQLDGPTHVVMDSTETYMFIADSNNDRIMRYLATSTSGNDGVVVAVSNGTYRELHFPL